MSNFINCDQCGQLTTKNTQWYYLAWFTGTKYFCCKACMEKHKKKINNNKSFGKVVGFAKG